MGRIVIWSASLGCALAAASSALAAEPATPAPAPNQADESFNAGHELLKSKRYADACPKFEESQREDPASGTLLALAYCQELSGLLATSWVNYIAAAQLAEREGHPERQSAATERAQALAERLSRLTLVVPQSLLALPGFRVLRDGIELERASFGVPVPMNGGSHRFEAFAPGRVPWASTVTLLPERDTKTLVLPVLDEAEPLGNSPMQGNTAPGPRVSHATPAAESERNVLLRRTSLVLAGGSVVALGLGAGFAISAASKNSSSNADGHCDATGCDARGLELRSDASAHARVATWSFVAAGALAAGSVGLYLTSASSSGSSQLTTRIQARVLPSSPSIVLSQTF